jgi:hypothetical protein
MKSWKSKSKQTIKSDSALCKADEKGGGTVKRNEMRLSPRKIFFKIMNGTGGRHGSI